MLINSWVVMCDFADVLDMYSGELFKPFVCSVSNIGVINYNGIILFRMLFYKSQVDFHERLLLFKEFKFLESQLMPLYGEQLHLENELSGISLRCSLLPARMR